MSGNIHERHRERLRAEFANGGFKDWHEHKTLEYILQYSRPRVDTNEIAHNLINACGGFAEVFKASDEVLMSVDGVGSKTVEYIHMLGEFVRYYNGVRFEANRLELNSESCCEYLLNLFDGKSREYFYMICLDSRSRILYCGALFEGGFDNMDVDTSKIVRTAVLYDAAYVVFAHNHPSGIAKPSNNDIITTHVIERALKYVNVEVRDHIIIALGKCSSMFNEGLLLRQRGK